MTLEVSVHKNILLRVLKDIYTNTATGPYLGFKGGTAAHLFYNLSRFSVDIDFDLLDPTKEEQISGKLMEILELHGTLRKTDKKRFSLFYMLSYFNKIQRAQNVKVEVNLRGHSSRYETKSYLGIAMKVMVKEDMFAHKLVAMYERIGRINRDIYDVWFFLKNNFPVNREIIERRTGMDLKILSQKCVRALEKMNDRGILSGMGELLDGKQKAWVKTSLRKDTIFMLKIMSDSGR